MPQNNNAPIIRGFNFNPNPGVQFTPLTPQLGDMNILERSLDKIENRHEKLTERMSAIDQALGKIGEQLHNDKETQEWFNNYKQRIKDNIWKAASIGDYGEAIRRANLSAGEIAQDNSLKNRVIANANYQKQDQIQQQRIANKEISHATYDWWKANNPYTFSENVDDNGNVTSWNEMNYNVPVADIDWGKYAAEAFSLVSENSKSVTNGNSSTHTTGGQQYRGTDGKMYNGAQMDENGKPSSVDATFQTSTSHSSQTSNSVHFKSFKSIQDVMDELAARHPDFYPALEQAFEIQNWQLQQAQKKLDNMDVSDPNYKKAKQNLDLLTKRNQRNGSNDLETYFKSALEENKLALHLSYNNTASSRIISNGDNNQYYWNIPSGNSNGATVPVGTNGGLQTTGSTVAIQGAHVVDNSNSSLVQNVVSNSISDYLNLMSSNNKNNNNAPAGSLDYGK